MLRAIHPDTAAALAAWDKGEPVRSIYLGHTQRSFVVEQGGHDAGTERIDHNSLPVHCRQDLAHAWCFAIIKHFLDVGLPHDHEEFQTIVDELANSEDSESELTVAERDGAESLAWKALVIGWEAAIEGMPSTRYVNVRRSSIEAT